MRAYKGVVKDRKVHFEEGADVKDGTVVLILLKPSQEDDEEITRRQLGILEKGYRMRRIIYTSREEVHER